MAIVVADACVRELFYGGSRVGCKKVHAKKEHATRVPPPRIAWN
jgi:hypothetical protein